MNTFDLPSSVGQSAPWMWFGWLHFCSLQQNLQLSMEVLLMLILNFLPHVSVSLIPRPLHALGTRLSVSCTQYAWCSTQMTCCISCSHTQSTLTTMPWGLLIPLPPTSWIGQPCISTILSCKSSKSCDFLTNHITQFDHVTFNQSHYSIESCDHIF